MSVIHLTATAVLVLSLVFIRWRRPQVALAVLFMVLGGAGWNLIRGIRPADDFEPGLLSAVNIFFVQVAVVAFYVTSRRLVHGRWRASWIWWAGVSLIAVIAGLSIMPQFGITSGETYHTSPAFVVHLVYCFAVLGLAGYNLTTRQSDPSHHVRTYIIGTEVSIVVLLALQMTLPTLAPLATVPIGLLSVWTTGHINEWSRSGARALRLIDSIGVFILVVDGNGKLLDWNGPAASLLELTGTVAEQELDVYQALGIKEPFADNSIVEVRVSGGMLRTTMTVHRLDPLSIDHDVVLMLRPLNSSVESSEFPRVSGALSGHDPATQTLCRRAALEEIRGAARDNAQVIRVDVRGAASSRADDVMFVVARRLESRVADRNWPELNWARLDTWTFVGVLAKDLPDRVLPMKVEVADLAVTLDIVGYEMRSGEAEADFVNRVLKTAAAPAEGQAVPGL